MDVATALVKAAGVSDAKASEVSLVLPPDLSQDEWVRLGTALGKLDRGMRWWLGDWCLYGERRWGETYAEGIKASGLDGESVRKATQVARMFQIGRRRPELHWTHHAECAFGLEPQEADNLLDKAVRLGWSARDVRREASLIKTAKRLGIPLPGAPGTCVVGDLHELVSQGRRFATFCVDAPWEHEGRDGKVSAEWHYPTMSVDDIAALPVPELAMPDSFLFLWAVNNLLPDAFEVARRWGFEYKTNFAWVKPQSNVGTYFRCAHELLLVAVRGNPGGFRDQSLRSWQEKPRGVHSEKPGEFRMMIERACVGPYLELFARHKTEGWTSWGNQILRCDFEASLPPRMIAA